MLEIWVFCLLEVFKILNLPFNDVVCFVQGTRHGDVDRPHKVHPIVHHINVEPVQPFSDGWRHMSGECSELSFEPFNFSLHVIWLE